MKADAYAKKYGRRYSPSGRSRSGRRKVRTWRWYIGPGMAFMALLAIGLVFAWVARAPAPSVAALGLTRVSSPVAAVSGPIASHAGTAPASGTEAGTNKPVERTAALPPLSLPADDAAHGSGMEWWYYNGILDAASGQRYAFHVAVFVANNFIKHTVMHVALTDLKTGKRYASQVRTGGSPAKQMTDGFDFRQDSWQVSAAGPSHTVRATFQGVTFALSLEDANPPVAHRAADSATPGLLDFGSSGISYYYSRPRITAQGEVSIDGKSVPVRGEVWFDHQWGDFDVMSLGWNWFAIHLDDGSDVMLYELFDMKRQKVMTAGTVSTPKGSRPLRDSDIELTPLRTWTSPILKIDYLVEWKLKLPSGEYQIKPFIDDSEFDSRASTANIYWEGPVKVSGPGGGGQGFMELSGYERLAPMPEKSARR